MVEELFRVTLQGYLEDKAEYFSDADFAKLFNISTEKANSLIGSSPKPIKENLTLEHAEQYKRKIEEAGVKCEVESMNFDGGLSLL